MDESGVQIPAGPPEESWQNGNALASKASGRKALQVRALHSPQRNKLLRNLNVAVTFKFLKKIYYVTIKI